ncbi:hypothetical protein DSLASN_21130 [Desulfoluna limicola]|uniref:Methyltransferase type 11 domain-containing protein n=1 Tax=Desulfoluna limicola TaxID=2810562 RepID=A0ABM7PFV8_9BACT|nr:DUF268 domain-containing protein [Desulfoluna limicola]BCS96481.1 hypothetical protein DSLASN_21130 [Desulfoluna limicola]
MLFKKKHPNKEYLKFIESVSNEYKKIGVCFEFRNHPISKENPKETPDHYGIFAYWVANKLKDLKGCNILDVGNTKTANLLNSINHNINALVLEKPIDDISNVNWTIHDISKKLNFIDNTFDIFTSPSSLHLVGQGRYGDNKDPLALINFIEELKRVMKDGSKMYLLLPLGKDQLLYGYHFIYSFETIKKIFKEWTVMDYMVDDEVKFGFNKTHSKKEKRFDQDTDISNFEIGQYKIIYLEFKKNNYLDQTS